MKNEELEKTSRLKTRTMSVSEMETVPGETPAAGPKAPTRLPAFMQNRYAVRRSVGHGGFGLVFLADDRKLGRLVAIKKLFDHLGANQDIRARFFQEARIAGQLEHPNIVTVYNIEELGQQVCLVMEYLGGGSLFDLMLNNPKMDIGVATQILLGILSGLDAAHQMQVVHRDIKPHNILFGFGCNPKITDFGIAHLPVHAGGSPFINVEAEKTTVVGTPMYMAPEQACLARIDARTDLYSAGAVFYEMLAGQRLFNISKESKYEDIREQILTCQPRPLKNFREDAPEELDQILGKMLAKRPDDRYPDATAVTKSLIDFLSRRNKQKQQAEGELGPTPISGFLNSPTAILEDIIFLLLVDGVMTRTEREELRRRTERLGLSEVQARLIEEKVRKNLGLPSLAHLEAYKQLEHSFRRETGTLTPEQEKVLAARRKAYRITTADLDDRPRSERR